MNSTIKNYNCQLYARISTAQNGDTRDDSFLWRNSSGSTAIYDRLHQSDDINIQQFDMQNYK